MRTKHFLLIVLGSLIIISGVYVFAEGTGTTRDASFTYNKSDFTTLQAKGLTNIQVGDVQCYTGICTFNLLDSKNKTITKLSFLMDKNDNVTVIGDKRDLEIKNYLGKAINPTTKATTPPSTPITKSKVVVTQR